MFSNTPITVYKLVQRLKGGRLASYNLCLIEVSEEEPLKSADVIYTPGQWTTPNPGFESTPLYAYKKRGVFYTGGPSVELWEAQAKIVRVYDPTKLKNQISFLGHRGANAATLTKKWKGWRKLDKTTELPQAVLLCGSIKLIKQIQ